MTYAAKVVAHSVGPDGTELISIEGTFPRFILAEVNTHKVTSKSSASSRAIPVAKRIAAVEAAPFVPTAFGKNQAGMQSSTVLDAEANAEATAAWENLCLYSLVTATKLAQLEVHKQYANRTIELFSWHTALLTGTEWANLLALRDHPDAQPEFQQFGRCLRESIAASVPKLLQPGEWHLPYITEEDRLQETNIEVLKMVSAGRSARLSYLTQDGRRDRSADVALFEDLRVNGHMSPMEHQGTPMAPELISRWKSAMKEFAHITDDRPFSGNFACWHQFRKSIPGERIFGSAK